MTITCHDCAGQYAAATGSSCPHKDQCGPCFEVHWCSECARDAAEDHAVEAVMDR